MSRAGAPGHARRVALPVLLLAAAGCGTGAVGTPPGDAARTAPVLVRSGPADPAVVDPAVLGAFSVVDVVFLQGMVPHHEQAVEISDIALTRSRSAPVRAVAEETRTALPGEARDMVSWLTVLGVAPDPGAAVHAHAGGMSADDVAALRTVPDAEFDRTFLGLLTEHQLGAVDLARSAAVTGSNEAVRRLAATIAGREWESVLTLRRLSGGLP